MLKKLSRNLAYHLQTKNVTLNNQMEVYIYGFEILISTLCGITSILILAKLLGIFCTTCIFLLNFIPLRMFLGGYHARTYRTCFWVSNISVIGLVCLQETTLVLYNKTICLGTMLLSIIIMCVSMNSFSDRCELSAKKTIVNKRCAFICIIVESFLAVIIGSIWHKYQVVVVLSMFLVAVFICVDEFEFVVKKSRRYL